MTTPAKSDLASPAAERSPFEAGPYPWIVNAAPFQTLASTTGRRVLLTVLVLWLPLAVLRGIQGQIMLVNPHDALLLDLRAHARYLIAGPLFVLAASVYLPQLAWAVRSFVAAGVIAKHDLPRYQALVASTARLLSSRLSGVAIVVFAYLVTFSAGPALYVATSQWAVSAGGELSLAGWWRVLVSQPLFLALWASWVWRVLLWGRFVWTVSRLDLRLVAGHPDRLGGLGFVVIPLRGFAILAFALGALTAGTVGEAVVFDGHLAVEYRYFIALHVLAVLAVFIGPLVPLAVPLLRLQARGTIEYGRLASNLGRQFEKRWIDAGRRDVDREALAASDFSATVDLYGLVSNAQSINPLVVEFRDVAMLVVAALLPFLPIVFAVIPLDQLVKLAMNALT